MYNTTGVLVNTSVASCIQNRQNVNVSVQPWLHKGWQIWDLRCYLNMLLKKKKHYCYFFIYQMDEKSETTAAFLSLSMSVQEIRRVNLIWSQRMNQVRTFLCSCGEARGMGVEKEERFLFPFPTRVQPRSMLSLYRQSLNILLAQFFIRFLKYKQCKFLIRVI